MPVSVLLAAAALVQAPDSQLLARALADLSARPVEAIGEDRVATTVRAHAFLDVDGDGRMELFLAIVPKYRQTATVVVYRARGTDSVERLYEGLAPGALVPVSGRQVDTHTLGTAIDMSVHGGADSTATTRVVAAARTYGMHVVRYPTFLHTDMRKPAAYVDAAATAPNETAKTCEQFEFAAVEALGAGRLGADSTGRYLVVVTAGDVAIYRFSGVTADGRLVKRVWILPRPRALATLEVLADGLVIGRTTDGRRVGLDAPR